MTAKCPSCHELTEHFKKTAHNPWDSPSDVFQCSECGGLHRREVLEAGGDTKVPIDKVWPVTTRGG